MELKQKFNYVLTQRFKLTEFGRTWGIPDDNKYN